MHQIWFSYGTQLIEGGLLMDHRFLWSLSLGYQPSNLQGLHMSQFLEHSLKRILVLDTLLIWHNQAFNHLCLPILFLILFEEMVEIEVVVPKICYDQLTLLKVPEKGEQDVQELDLVFALGYLDGGSLTLKLGKEGDLLDHVLHCLNISSLCYVDSAEEEILDNAKLETHEDV